MIVTHRDHGARARHLSRTTHHQATSPGPASTIYQTLTKWPWFGELGERGYVRADDDRVWTRLLELVADPDPPVRGDVIHALTDSTPAPRVPAVIQALESRHNDPDERIRRRSARPSLTTAGPGR